MAINIRTDKNYRSESSCTFCQGAHTITGCENLKEQAILGENLQTTLCYAVRRDKSKSKDQAKNKC